jgi:hypothetical protein
MLKIKIELWPFGDETRKREIASMDLWNDGTGNVYNGNYEGKASVPASIYSEKQEAHGIVSKYDRQQNVWNLVARMLKSMGYA